VDPEVEQTQQAFIYAGDDPVNATDPTGRARRNFKEWMTPVTGVTP